MIWKFFTKSPQKSDLRKLEPSKFETVLPLAFLQKLIPISAIPVAELQTYKARISSFNPGQIIFNRGENADSLAYLFSGHVFMEAANGTGYSVDEETFQACYPLSTHTEHYFSAIAKSPTRIVYLPLSVLCRCTQVASTNNPLNQLKDIPENLTESQFFNGFCNCFRHDELHVPSLPDVAIRLRSALEKEISIQDAVKIINLDPVITSKLIQVSNSPLYRTVTPIATCHDAITRLGLKATQNLATSISLHNLFRSNNRTLNKHIQQLWKHSIQIASLSYTLAGMTKTINPDEALLAGLVHRIGALPIITYAESIKSIPYNEDELDQTIEVLQGLVGAYILKKWNFPDTIRQIPNQSHNWYHDNNQELQMSDIVLLANFHAQLGTSNALRLPPLNTLPAFLKLGKYTLTPDMSLQALLDAKQQIAEAVSFFRT